MGASELPTRTVTVKRYSMLGGLGGQAEPEEAIAVKKMNGARTGRRMVALVFGMRATGVAASGVLGLFLRFLGIER